MQHNFLYTRSVTKSYFEKIIVHANSTHYYSKISEYILVLKDGDFHFISISTTICETSYHHQFVAREDCY